MLEPTSLRPSGTSSGGTTSASSARLPDWENVLFAAAHLQPVVLDAVLAGGSAAVLHAGHRVSLGSLDGILTGVRQLIRIKPLETQTVQWRGQAITVPTRVLMLRIEAVLILKRNATRDDPDFLALFEKLGEEASAEALRCLDRLYPQPSGESPLRQLVVQLASPLPYDLEETHLNVRGGACWRVDAATVRSPACLRIPTRAYSLQARRIGFPA